MQSKFSIFIKVLSIIVIYACIAVDVIAAENFSSHQVLVNNSLGACLQVKLLKSKTHNNIALLDATLDLKNSVGNCGCQSKNLSYFVNGMDNTVEEYAVFLPRDGVYTFVLNRERDTNNKDIEPYTLNIQCAGPE